MANEKLKEYINEKISMGYGLEAIKSSLLKWGYDADDVNETINSLSTHPLSAQKQEASKFIFKSPAFLKLFFSPKDFFSNVNYHYINKSLKPFIYSFLVFFLIRLIALLVQGILGKTQAAILIASLLANITSLIMFAVFLLLFSFLLIFLFFIMLKYILKADASFPSVMVFFLLSLIPFVLINSIYPRWIYEMLSVFNLAIGPLGINIFFFWALALFSAGMSAEMNIPFWRSAAYAFFAFVLVLGIFSFVFSGTVQFSSFLDVLKRL